MDPERGARRGRRQLRIERPVRAPRTLPAWLRRPAVAVAGVVLAGAVLEPAMGSRFVFAGTAVYDAVLPLLGGVLFVAFAAALYGLDAVRPNLREAFPSRVLRWLLVVPVFAALLAGASVMAPLGWAALLGAMSGNGVEGVKIDVEWIGDQRPRLFACNRHAVLRHGEQKAWLCVEDIVEGGALREGTTVTASGRLSAFGLRIDRLQAN